MTSERFQVGDLVWGKMKGFQPWPGKIENPPEHKKKTVIKKNTQWIFFFGSHDYAPIPDVDIKDYHEYKNTFSNGKKSGSIKQAIVEIEEYIKSEGIIPRNKEDDRLCEEETPVTVNTSVQDNDVEFDALFGTNTHSKVGEGSSSKRKNLCNGRGDVFSSSGSAKKMKESNKKKTLLKQFQNDRKKTDAKEDSGGGGDTSWCPPKPSTPASAFLNRPVLPTRPVSPNTYDHISTSKTLNSKDVKPSSLKFGFIGLGIMGSSIVRNLISSGHNVTIWNRRTEKTKQFISAGAKICLTPGDVIAETDITFSCIADPQSAKEIVFGNCGVLTEINSTKSYVEMTGMDPETSQDIAEAVSLKGGRYLEAQLQGSKDEATNGSLTVLAAGDKSLYDECQSCFLAMSSYSTYLGDIGNACKMYLVLQMISGISLAGLAEGMAVADRAGLQNEEMMRILAHTSMNSPLLIEKGRAIIEGQFRTKQPLRHLQKDMKLLLGMGDHLEQPLPLTAATNEVFKHAKRLGYGEHDTSAVYIRARF